jgi:isopenicillin-N N-acyltransferase like protein
VEEERDMSFPYIEVAGGPRERGRQYGEAARERVRASRKIYFPAFAARGLEWPRVRELASGFAAAVQGYEPAFVEEMRGIADGAGVEFEEIVALNARTELLYWQDEGCTGAACMPEVTASGHTLLGQNWDWRPACRESAVVLHVRPDDGPEFITFVEAGLLARAGLNSAGVGVTGNFLQSDADFGRAGIPIPFIRRRILSSRSLAEAVGWVVRTPRAFSSNHLVAHAPGEAIDCEAAPEDVFFLHPEGGILEHSNHFRAAAAPARLRDTGIARYPDTLYRDRRLRRALAAKAPSILVEDFQAALRDHYGKPDSVCRHDAARSDGTMITTVASLVMDLHEGRLWVAPGPVCEHEYREYRLGEVLAHAV